MACILILLSLWITVIAAADTVDCGNEGWSYYPPTGFCYGANINLQKYTWTNGEAYCKANGGHIATINSLDEYKLITSYSYTAWDNKYGNWIGYYTDSGTNFDPKNWIPIDGSHSSEALKHGKWCNEFRWGAQVKRASGRRCLALGWDEKKFCLYDMDCNVNPHKIICKRPPKAGAASLLPALISTDKYDCGGDGWSYYPPTGYCYGASVGLQRETFVKGERYCQDFGGHMATIESEAEFKHLLIITQNFRIFLGWDNVYGNWIGYYTDVGTNFDPKNWISVDGSNSEGLKYGKWCNEFRYGIQIARVGGKRCLGMGWDSEKIGYFDANCDGLGPHGTMKVICKKPPNTFPKNSPLPGLAPADVDCGGQGWSYYPPTGFCYGANIELQRKTWTRAEEYCTANGGHQITINSLEEYQHFVSYVFTAWEGLYGNWVGYYTEEGSKYATAKWESVDGTAVDFLKYAKWCNDARWGGMYKPGSGRRCLGYGWDQEKMCWYDLDCDIGGRFATMKIICKRSPKLLAKDKPLPSLLPAPVNCDGDGWSYYPPTGYCYGANIELQRNSFNNAEKYCKDNGGHLATFDSEVEYKHLLSYIFLTWDNVYGNWLGYYTDVGTNFDSKNWIAVDGSNSEALKYGKWCNEFRYGIQIARVGGKRCLGIGWDLIKICLYDADCNGNGRQGSMKVMCKRPPIKSEANEQIPVVMEDNTPDPIPTASVAVTTKRTSCRV